MTVNAVAVSRIYSCVAYYHSACVGKRCLSCVITGAFLNGKTKCSKILRMVCPVSHFYIGIGRIRHKAAASFPPALSPATTPRRPCAVSAVRLGWVRGVVTGDEVEDLGVGDLAHVTSPDWSAMRLVSQSGCGSGTEARSSAV